MYRILKKAKDRSGKYRIIFIAALLLSFHFYLVTYINSTYLGGFVDPSVVGILYALSSVINIYLFLKTPSLIKKYGNYKFIIIISIVEILGLFGMTLTSIPALVITAFIIHHSINSIILSCLDIYLEDSGNTDHMGKLRGTFLTILSIAAIASPLAIGSLLKNGDFSKIYFFSIFFMFLFLFWIIRRFKTMPSGQFREIKIFRELKEFYKLEKIRNITFCHFVLQFFYSWMIIYVPIYLVGEMGFDWGDAALIISISLLPFLLFEIPIGEMADKRQGEREIIITGFIISGLVLLLFPMIPKGHFIFWTTALFITRIGASLIETATESYFFRNTEGKDELIEVFRISGPFAFIVGPTIGSLLLLFMPSLRSIFPVLGIVMFLGVLLALRLRSGVRKEPAAA